MKKKRFSQDKIRIVPAIVLVFMFIVSVYPILWMFAGSLKTTNEFYTNIWGFSLKPQFSNYLSAWKAGTLGMKFLNSIFVTSLSLAILIPVNSFAAYAIARQRFAGKTVIYMILLSGIMIPAGVLGIPTFTVALHFGINNTRTGLAVILAAQSIAMGVFIMRSFFISLPTSLEEAAMIDGCSPFGSFLRIILPLAKAGVVTQVIFNGLTNWNEYFMTSIMISTPDRQTLPLSIANFVGRHNVDYPQLFAVLSIVTLPVIIVYLFSQKAFIEGVSAGSVKG